MGYPAVRHQQWRAGDRLPVPGRRLCECARKVDDPDQLLGSGSPGPGRAGRDACRGTEASRARYGQILYPNYAEISHAIRSHADVQSTRGDRPAWRVSSDALVAVEKGLTDPSESDAVPAFFEGAEVTDRLIASAA